MAKKAGEDDKDKSDVGHAASVTDGVYRTVNIVLMKWGMAGAMILVLGGFLLIVHMQLLLPAGVQQREFIDKLDKKMDTDAATNDIMTKSLQGMHDGVVSLNETNKTISTIAGEQLKATQELTGLTRQEHVQRHNEHDQIQKALQRLTGHKDESKEPDKHQ